jgi:23S rRNA pseudouridine2605 synthase
MPPLPDRHVRSASRSSTGLARALSKLGFCSRSRARELILAGHVRVNGILRRDPEWRVSPGHDRIVVDEQHVKAAAKAYVMLNKPRGLVTTAVDEQERQTVYECLQSADLPFLSPVGRLDKASEGLLLLTNDTEWAVRITDPATQLEKVYHVQIDCVPDTSLLARLAAGVTTDGEFLRVVRADMLRAGARNGWLEIVLSEGRNRHIRRLLEALGIGVLRLVRIAIGELKLGDLPKGSFRHLAPHEVLSLAKNVSR